MKAAVRTAGVGADPVVLRTDDGTPLPLDPARWHADPTAGEESLLAATVAPVLDVGCGPGRLVLGLARRGAVALGVDPAPAACALARKRGAPVLQRSVFDPLPGQGRWRTILLADGNIGIGGDPGRLLQRCRELLAGDGTVVVEVLRPGSGWRSHRVRLERGGHHGPWFSWATVDADAIAGLARAAGLELRHLQQLAAENRWFAHLGRPCTRERLVAVS
jgi:SAM-dependent methyltransferase